MWHLGAARERRNTLQESWGEALGRLSLKVHPEVFTSQKTGPRRWAGALGEAHLIAHLAGPEASGAAGQTLVLEGAGLGKAMVPREAWEAGAGCAVVCLSSPLAKAFLPTWCPEGKWGFPCWKQSVAELSAGGHACQSP